MINNSINRFIGVMCYPLTETALMEQELFEQYYNEQSFEKKQAIKKEILLKVIKSVQEHYTIYSYDEIHMLLEKFFFYEKKCNCTYDCIYHLLRKLSTSLLSHLDGKLVYKYWCNEHDNDILGGFAEENKLLLFHSFNLHIPMDLMAIIYMIENNNGNIHQLHNFYGQIVVADLQLNQQLELGVAENHMHSGASMPFLRMWNMIMKPITKSEEEKFKKLIWKDTLYIDGNKIWYLVLSASILRMVIALYQFPNRDEIFDNSPEITYFLDYFTYKRNLRELYHRLDNQSTRDIFSYYMKLWDELSRYISLESNIMYTIFQVDKRLKTSEENIFLFQTLRYLREKKDCYKRIEILFLNYIRIKNTFFELLVQQKTTKGLDYFQSQFYSHNSKMVNFIDHDFWEMIIREQFQNRNLKKIEFRMSVGTRESSFRKNIKSFLESYLNIIQSDYCVMEDNKYKVVQSFPRVGIVFSLLKRADVNPQEKCYIDGFVNAEKLQYQTLRNQYKEQIEFIKNLRNENSEMSKYLVGIDAASLENETPVWVFAPIYEFARDSMFDPLIVGHSFYQSLNFTFHAGEDFRHILSGIRRIDEAVTHLKFHAGDRIGHGIALGLDVQKWFEENPVVILPRIELLENFLWSYHTLSSVKEDMNSSIMSYIEKRIYDLTKEIYCSTAGIKTEVLIDAYLNMFHIKNSLSCEEDYVHNIFCKYLIEGKEIVWNVEKLCIARNCNYYTKRMNEPVHLKVTEQELEITEQLQKIVRRKLSQMGIVLEINPSSNVSISSMDSLYENQIYSINSFLQEDSNVMVCINSDDPSVFNTNVSNELAYIFNALLQKGVSKEDAMRWIEKLRINGINSSFIRRNDSDQQVLEALIQLVDSL